MQRPQIWLVHVLRRTPWPNVVHLYVWADDLLVDLRRGIWALPPIWGPGKVSHLPQLPCVLEGAAKARRVRLPKARSAGMAFMVAWKGMVWWVRW